MSEHYSTRKLVLVLAGACFMWAAGWTELPARAQHTGHDHAVDQQAQHPGQRHPAGTTPAAAARGAAHGGQLTKTDSYCAEVVYRPKETRVYLYDRSMRALAARGVQGRVAMKVEGHEQIFRYPLKYVAGAAGSRDQDYLSVKVDVGRVRDGSMAATFELAGLPQARQPQATFTQKFAISKLKVTIAALTKADQSGIARQKVCPVLGTKLGGHGTPVKVLIGERPVYLCCKGCLGEVQKDPEQYLHKVYPALAAGNRIMVATATPADQAAIRAQRLCAVSGSPLGAMGTPVKVTVGEKSLLLCCKGCLAKVQADPEPYLRKAA